MFFNAPSTAKVISGRHTCSGRILCLLQSKRKTTHAKTDRQLYWTKKTKKAPGLKCNVRTCLDIFCNPRGDRVLSDWLGLVSRLCSGWLSPGKSDPKHSPREEIPGDDSKDTSYRHRSEGQSLRPPLDCPTWGRYELQARK